MNTTNLFVELIVIGVGAIIWLGFILFTILGFDIELIKTISTSSAAAIPALAITYLLGIITDRLADLIFKYARTQAKTDQVYRFRNQYFYDRDLVLSRAEQFARQYEYSRSRQRICRSWALNAFLIVITFNLFLLIHPGALQINGLQQLGLSLIFLSIFAGCWLSWETMTTTELIRLKQQAALFRKRRHSKKHFNRRPQQKQKEG